MSDSRIRYANKFGETLTFLELKQRWDCNDKFINEIAFAKQILVYLDDRQAAVIKVDGKRVFHFWKLAPEGVDYFSENSRDCPQYQELPDNTYFYWTDILAFEDKYPEIKERIGELNKSNNQDDELKPVEKIESSIGKNPWEIPDPRDPEPEYDWYIPARYFAKQSVKNDSTLLLKRDKLCQQIVTLLDKVGIKKRGGKKSFASITINKALTNVILS